MKLVHFNFGISWRSIQFVNCSRYVYFITSFSWTVCSFCTTFFTVIFPKLLTFCIVFKNNSVWLLNNGCSYFRGSSGADNAKLRVDSRTKLPCKWWFSSRQSCQSSWPSSPNSNKCFGSTWEPSIPQWFFFRLPWDFYGLEEAPQVKSFFGNICHGPL